MRYICLYVKGDVIPSVAPIPSYDLDDVKGAAMVVNDNAQEEPLIVWDERNPTMDIGTPYPDMVAFRKALMLEICRRGN